MSYIAVTGSGEAPPEIAVLAEQVGALIAQRGAVVVTGGLAGVMEAASRGARAAGGCVLAILPGESRRGATEHAHQVVATGTGQARNLAIAASCDGMIAVAGEWGTLSEIALARKLGRPVVTLRGRRIEGVERAADPAEAVACLFGMLEPLGRASS